MTPILIQESPRAIAEEDLYFLLAKKLHFLSCVSAGGGRFHILKIHLDYMRQ